MAKRTANTASSGEGVGPTAAEEEVAARDQAQADRIERKEVELAEQEEARSARMARKEAEQGNAPQEGRGEVADPDAEEAAEDTEQD